MDTVSFICSRCQCKKLGLGTFVCRDPSLFKKTVKGRMVYSIHSLEYLLININLKYVVAMSSCHSWNNSQKEHSCCVTIPFWIVTSQSRETLGTVLGLPKLVHCATSEQVNYQYFQEPIEVLGADCHYFQDPRSHSKADF